MTQLAIFTDIAIFTNLDGTLPGHDSQSWQPARPCLARLTRAAIPMMLVSSGAAAEVTPLRAALGLADWPAIVEGGAGILPAHARQVPGEDYAAIMEVLTARPEARRNFRSAGNIGADKDRLAEPPRPAPWESDGEGSVACIGGPEAGRIFTLAYGRTRAQAMGELRHALGARLVVALGDAPEDAAMLEAADIGIVVANPARPPLPSLANEAAGRIIRTRLPGPEGWAAALMRLLDAAGLSR